MVSGCNKSLITTTHIHMISDLEQIFIGVIKENMGIIGKVCRMYHSNDDDIQDLQQEILVQLWRGFPRFRGESKISTWIYRVALNTAISDFRRAKVIPYKQSIGERELRLAEPEESTDKEDLEILYRVIEQLSGIEKAITLFYLEDTPYDEIAEIIGITRNNLRVKMFRIKEKLRKIIQKHEQ